MRSASELIEYGASIFRRRPYIAYSMILLIVITGLYNLKSASPPKSQVLGYSIRTNSFDGRWDSQRDSKNLMLSDEQCDQAFPGLFEEVERPVQSRRGKNITLEEVDAITPVNGYVRAMIYEQELYILATSGSIYSRGLATLHALHRAIITSPSLLPNIEFTFVTDDKLSDQSTWLYARRPSDTSVWLMPDFGYWSWPETKVGSYGEVQRKAREAEAGTWNWNAKKEQLVWRGAAMGLEVRKKFIEVTQGEEWADVKEIKWHDEDSMRDDLLSMDEHCHYKYVAHTEGNSYSGRLKYLQNCRSVVFAHSMDWIQHNTPLMRSSGPDQRYVEVKKDFSDLKEKMIYFIRNDEEASRIAENSVRMFRDRYASPAAETCYWRRLIRGWAAVSFEPEFYRVTENGKEWRGVPWESYALERRLEWDPY